MKKEEKYHSIPGNPDCIPENPFKKGFFEAIRSGDITCRIVPPHLVSFTAAAIGVGFIILAMYFILSGN